MKAKDIRPGEVITLNGRSHIVVDAYTLQDGNVRLVVSKVDNNLEVVYIDRDVETPSTPLRLARDEIIIDMVSQLQARLDHGVKSYGTDMWTGKDPIGNAEEELWDALIYLWVHRKLKEKALDAVGAGNGHK